jgi:hypothetical protein
VKGKDIEGEFGNEGNPPGAKAPRTPAMGEFGGEGNPPSLRPEDADPERRPATHPKDSDPREPRDPAGAG